MRIIVTRPREEGARWVARLREHGIDAVALPLIEIAAPPDVQAVRAAWHRLDQVRAIMFVSGNAVRGFFAHRIAGLSFDVRAWAPGPGTRDALLEEGVHAERVDTPPAEAAQFDSETLWPLVRPQVAAGDRVLVVRGGDAQGRAAGRDWIAQQVIAAGGDVESVVAYVRRVPQWTRQEHAVALDTGCAWLFSSSEAVANLSKLLPGHDWSGAKAWATHPRIGEAATAAGFGHVRLCAPGLAAVVTSLKSLG